MKNDHNWFQHEKDGQLFEDFFTVFFWCVSALNHPVHSVKPQVPVHYCRARKAPIIFFFLVFAEGRGVNF